MLLCLIDWMSSINEQTQLHIVFLCLYMAEPATFLASNGIPLWEQLVYSLMEKRLYYYFINIIYINYIVPLWYRNQTLTFSLMRAQICHKSDGPRRHHLRAQLTQWSSSQSVSCLLLQPVNGPGSLSAARSPSSSLTLFKVWYLKRTGFLNVTFFYW